MIDSDTSLVISALDCYKSMSDVEVIFISLK